MGWVEDWLTGDPILFIIFLSDLDDEMKHTLLNLANDTKLCGGEQGVWEEKPTLQEDWKRGEKKSTMKFHKHKCKALYLGKSVQHRDQLCERGLFWKGTWEIWGEPSLKE